MCPSLEKEPESDPDQSPALIIASNRLPITIEKKESGALQVNLSSGGLVSGLADIQKSRGLRWVGHCGLFVNEGGYNDVKNQLADQLLIPVPLKKKQYKAFYNGMSNGEIWPLFHYFPNAAKFSEEDWSAYVEVNEKFAETIIGVAAPGDRIWVHDYQLMLLPKLLRQANRNYQIAYFHHIPFPSSEVFRILPSREQLLTGLLGADLIGFHTYDYVRHFLSAVTRTLGNDIHTSEILEGERLVKVVANPVGLHVGSIQDILKSIRQQPPQEEFGQSNEIIFLGIDRLDYSKGIPERLQAFRQFLTEHPEYVGRVTLIQLCVPSREEILSYGNMRTTVERLVGQINGQFAKPGYTPIQYLYRFLPAPEVYNLYQKSHVALVTPLRDGLNLVCKEYVAARADNDGVLILSEFAGAAAEMGEALLVNPFDVRNIAEAMFEAVQMQKAERRRRMQLLRARVMSHDNQKWAESFLDSWKRAAEPIEKSVRLTGESVPELINKVAEGRRLFLCLDNDGTLTPIAQRPELAIPAPEVCQLVARLGERFNVSVVTGRPKDYCQEYFGDLPVNLIAEHGTFMRARGADRWQVCVGLEEFMELKSEIMALLTTYTSFVPGSHVEEKDSSLVWHFRQAEPIFARAQSMELSASLEQLLGQTSFSVAHGKKTIEVRHVVANKGHAVETILSTAGWCSGEDVLMTIGDDTTDEDMYRVYPQDNLSIHIGKPNHYAKFYITNQKELFGFLDNLGRELPRGTPPSSGPQEKNLNTVEP